MDNTTTILVIDDDIDMREVLAALITAQGYEALVAPDGELGLELARRTPPDLVLLDVMMPRLSGFEVCRALRADPLTAEVPIIMLTALDDRESRLKGVQAGADEFLSKPVDLVELKARLGTIVRLNRYRKLHQERQLLEWVIDQADQGFMIIDEEGRIRQVNDRARAYLELDDDEAVLGDEVLAVFARRFQLRPAENWADWPAPSPTPRFIVRPENSTARAAWLAVESRTAPVDPRRWLIALRDASRDFERGYEVWRMHSAISHKLRTPLTGVISVLELLNNGRLGASHPSYPNMLRLAYTQALQLKETISKALGFAEAQRLVPAGGGGTVRGVRDAAVSMARELGLAPIQFDIAEEVLDQRLRLSEDLCAAMVRELLENAQKHHPHGSPHIILACRLDGEALLLSVSDDGLTLSLDQMSRLGIPYYQAEKHFTGQVPGAGLGLATIRALLWSVGGDWEMSNRRPGPGVTVTLRLPVAAAEQVAA